MAPSSHKPKSTKTNESEQLERFREAARELGCDEDEAAFDEKLKVLAKRKLPATQKSEESSDSS